jgi:dUTP pyrophosphatase
MPYLLKLHVSESMKNYYQYAIDEWHKKTAYPDAGFDLFSPETIEIASRATCKLDHDVKSCMVWVNDDGDETPVAFYLYPRSSTGTKTPLRLANSVGIIDAGYRGSLIAAFDNWSNEPYVVTKGQRLVQICPPDLSNYPLLVELVDELDATERGEGGFGSTGM